MPITDIQIKAWLECNQYLFKEQEPLKKHTTFKIGGNCLFLVMPKSTAELSALLRFCRNGLTPYYIIGKGSNILADDAGFHGVVVKLGDAFSKIEVVGTEMWCEAGASLSSVCYTAYEYGLTGLEFAWGIPGTVGGALFMNAGAYGGEMKTIVTGSEYLDENGGLNYHDADELLLSYRHSIYTDHPDYCITKVKLKLERGNKKTIKEQMDELMERRKSKQPLEFPSAGSTFKRPEGNYASALIEQCGLKGVSVGDAQVSKKHSGFLINRGNASCEDVLELISLVKNKVKSETGYVLECEVRRLP